MTSFLMAALLAQASDACASSPSRAEPFAPALSDSGRLFRGTFSADGQTLYYFRKQKPDQEDYRIYVSRHRNGRWPAGERLILGGEFSDLYPSVSPDGSRLVFASYRPAPGDTAATPNAYLWYADREGSGWGSPRFIGPAARFGAYHSGPMIDSSLAIRFTRTSGDWRTRWSLMTRWTGDRYAEAVEVPDDPAGAWRKWRTNELYVWGGQRDPSGTVTLLDVSLLDARGRRGPSDIWISLRQNDGWTDPVPAGAGVNREDYDNFVTFHPDRCSIVFVRGFSSFFRVSIAALVEPARR